MSQEVKASLRFLKMGPRKVRLIADTMRGHKVTILLERLMVKPQAASLPMLKLLKSAVANAKNNFKFDLDTLRVKEIMVDGGPVVKRWTPRAHGRATPIRQRTSHIHLTLISEEPKAKKEKKAKKAVKTAKAKK